MRRYLGILFAAGPLLLAACHSDATAPWHESNASPEIRDGAHLGNIHFYFLPPVQPAPSYSGSSDPALHPSVSICEWNPVGSRCDAVIAEFATGGTASETVTYDVMGEKYQVNWHTDQCLAGACTLDPAKTYRIRVMIGAIELGHADVDVVASGAQLKNVQTNEYIALVNGRTLPVKFRIEQGAVAVLPLGGSAAVGASGGNVTTADGSVGLVIPEGALASTTSISAAVVQPPVEGTGPWAPVIQLGPDGTTFAQPVTLTLAFDPLRLPPGMPSSALGIYTFDGTGWEVVEGSVVNETDQTVSASITHFSYYWIGVLATDVNWVTTPSVLTVGQSTVYTAQLGYCTGTFSGNCWPTANVAVRWSSTVPGVASVAAGPTYTNANGAAQSPPIVARALGSANILATRRLSTFSTLSGTRGVTVVPSLTLSVFNVTPNQANGTEVQSNNSFRDVGVGQQVSFVATIPSAPATDLIVSLIHTNPAATSLFATVLVPSGGTQSGRNQVVGLAAGRDTIVATAPGYAPDTLIVDVDRGTMQIPGWPSTLAVGDSVLLRIWSMNPSGTYSDWRPDFASFSLGGNPNLRFSAVANASFPVCSFGACTFPVPFGYSTQAFYLKALLPGTGTATVQSFPNYLAYSNSVNITGPAFATIEVTPDPAGVRPGQTVQLTGTPRDAANNTVSGVTLSWSSASPAVATVDQNGLVTGVANGTVVITASSNGVSGTATVYVGTPSIAPSPTSVTIPVAQGTSNSAHITINNGGSGLLTGLQAGSFSNYFNGSPAPWVTASFNTTTAPATLTITATPGLDVPAGVHQLRFDVYAPGVNSFTFYSINITVYPFGVTPVNATIAPNPTSASLTVAIGETAQAQIAINNSGTDPLANLAAGPFSNYFNGSPAPWVTAALNTTTAPATLTITAAPNANVATGSHQLRFDVTSPGATNSPYTFYSINVTVTPGLAISQFDLGALGANSSLAITLNESGRIVGASGSAAAYWPNLTAAITAIPNPYGDLNQAEDINEAGIIAGHTPYVGWLFDPVGGALRVAPGPFTQNNRTFAMGLNDNGLVLACADNGSFAQSYVWTLSNNQTTLIPNAYNQCGGRINDSGLAITSSSPGAGGSAWFWNQSTVAVTGLPSLGGVTVGYDINASGVVVGSSQNGSGQPRAFRWDSGTGQMVDLGTLGGTQAEAKGINDAGWIVGWSLTAAGEKHGFLRNPVSGRMYDLGVLPGYAGSEARDINNAMDVVGWSINGSATRAMRWKAQ